MKSVFLPVYILALWLFSVPVLGAGVVESRRLYSEELGVTKNYIVYLPEGYDTTAAYYPVIYVLHGWGVTERSWTSPALNIQGAADDMRLRAVIVMPDGDRGVYANAQGSQDYWGCMNAEQPYPNSNEPREEFCVISADYEDYLLEEIIPHVERTYRVMPTREARAVTGESAGGLAAMQLALRNKAVFSSVASHSGILALDGVEAGLRRRTGTGETRGFEDWSDIFGLDSARWRGHDPMDLLDNLRNGELSIYVDCGTEDEGGFFRQAQQFQEKLDAVGIDHFYAWQEGGRHDDVQFGSRMPVSLAFHRDHFLAQRVYPPAGQ